MFDLKAFVTTATQTRQDAVCRVAEQENGVRAVYVEASAKEAIDPDVGVRVKLAPKQPVRRYMADFRVTQSWCKPYFGEDLTQMPDDTQALVLELENGEFCVIVPVVNDTYRCVLRGEEDGMTAVAVSWYEGLTACNGLAFVYAWGSTPGELMAQCVRTAVELLGSRILLREQREYPEILEYLGWCSWDSMQIRVNEEGVLEKCEEFRIKQIPVKWGILDDMWAEVRDFYGKTYNNFEEMLSLMHASKLYSLEADPYRFPKGLAHCIRKVKEYGMQIGMWYPVAGYWNGIAPEGPLYEAVSEHLLYSRKNNWVPNWEYDHSHAYFTHVMRFLKGCGADFIKVDNQGIFYRRYKGFAPIGKMARQFHDGMEDAAKEQFDSRMINCMGMAAENIWSRSVSPLSRCSDDFIPENKEWFTKHVLQCAYNSLLQGQLYWCDWDMWWTDDGQAKKNSLVRAVSGGPVYVSDKLQRSRPEVLKPLTLDDGRILRCDRPCIPTTDCAAVDPTVSGKAMKLQNMAGEHGILAVLNLDEHAKPVTAVISGEMIDGFEAEEYAVYEHFSRECRILKKGESFTVTLEDENDYKLYILAPVHDGFAAIGRTDKFISPKTIRAVHGTELELVEDGPRAYVLDGKLYTLDV